jgi:CDGSH-type Zn-finger protein
MNEKTKTPKIHILKNGPYLITGKVTISEKAVVPVGKTYEYTHLQDYSVGEGTALCRCGISKNAPFCDGSHVGEEFDGTETAGNEEYYERAKGFKGPGLTLYDDGRCALARFCHREQGLVWDLVQSSNDPQIKEEIIRTAADCPAGRFEIRNNAGDIIKPYFEPAIEVLQDIEREVSGPLAVKGNISIESSDGTEYETRFRTSLCRCGASKNKPFCDATHAFIGFRDDAP